MNSNLEFILNNKYLSKSYEINYPLIIILFLFIILVIFIVLYKYKSNDPNENTELKDL